MLIRRKGNRDQRAQSVIEESTTKPNESSGGSDDLDEFRREMGFDEADGDEQPPLVSVTSHHGSVSSPSSLSSPPPHVPSLNTELLHSPPPSEHVKEPKKSPRMSLVAMFRHQSVGSKEEDNARRAAQSANTNNSNNSSTSPAPRRAAPVTTAVSPRLLAEVSPRGSSRRGAGGLQRDSVRDVEGRRAMMSRRSRSMNSLLSANGEDEQGGIGGPGVFKKPLKQLLEEEGSTQNGSVPRVMELLLEGVVRSGGFKSEGIFRLSVGTQQKYAAMEKIHRGDYSAITESDDPHLHCVLLKEWLKLLPEPLVSNYDAALSMAQAPEGPELQQALESLWTSMDDESQSVLKRLMLFVKEAVNHEQTTRMNATNLCIVFAPGILRSKKEQSAVEMLRDQPTTHRALLRMYNFIVSKN